MAARLVVVVAGLLVTGLSACGHLGPDGTPSAQLFSGPTIHRICMPTPDARRVTLGLDAVGVRGTGEVTIRGARLSHQAGPLPGPIELIEVRPRDQFATIGLWSGYPPRFGSDGLDERAAWARRRQAVGATLLPTGPHRYYNLVFGLQVAARGKSTPFQGPLVIDYVDSSGHEGTWTSKITYRLAGNCDDPSDRD